MTDSKTQPANEAVIAAHVALLERVNKELAKDGDADGNEPLGAVCRAGLSLASDIERLRAAIEKTITNIKDYERYGTISHGVAQELSMYLGRALDAKPAVPALNEA